MRVGLLDEQREKKEEKVQVQVVVGKVLERLRGHGNFNCEVGHYSR